MSLGEFQENLRVGESLPLGFHPDSCKPAVPSQKILVELLRRGNDANYAEFAISAVDSCAASRSDRHRLAAFHRSC